MRKINLHQFNNLLNIVLVILAFYILSWPFYPVFSLWIHRKLDDTGGYVYQTRLSNNPNGKPIPPDNRLVIPKLIVDQPIKEGNTIGVISHDGTWRRPLSSNPSKGGNTVIIAHRFYYHAVEAPFYHLDILRPGDDIIIYWQGQEYDYKVSSDKTVDPKEAGIEKSTTKPTLTLYTCTPLWTAKQRLVITAEPTEALRNE